MLPQVKTILYATGLDPGAPYVFRYALSLARQQQANIVIVHGIEPLTPFGQSLVEQYISHEHSEEIHRKARETARASINERLTRLCETECSDPAQCEKLVDSIRIVEGYPDQAILAAAKDCAADLIVMGSHRHTVVGEVIMGSTTRKVLHSTSLPVLVVRIPEGYTEELR